jgi:putative transposase
VSRLCARYGVSRAGYYAWRKRGESARSHQDREIEKLLVELFKASGGTYGTPRLQRGLRDRGVRTSRRRVSRLMRAAGLVPRMSQIYRSNPKLHRLYKGKNLQRKLAPTGVDQVWVGDVTYLRVGKRWRYLAAVIDRFSRRTVGWSLGRRRCVALTRRALRNALRVRRPEPGLIFHSDRGTEYVGAESRAYLERCGIRQSLTERSLGDNPYAETFFHSFKADVIHGRRFRSEAALRGVVSGYMRQYNHRRLHSGLHYVTPVAFEKAN